MTKKLLIGILVVLSTLAGVFIAFKTFFSRNKKSKKDEEFFDPQVFKIKDVDDRNLIVYEDSKEWKECNL